jgi:hypothetical protein
MEQQTDRAFSANPFASFMDSTPCLAAHFRLSHLPQAQYRPLDKPRIVASGAPAAEVEDGDDVVTEMADFDDFGGGSDMTDILSVSPELHC